MATISPLFLPLQKKNSHTKVGTCPLFYYFYFLSGLLQNRTLIIDCSLCCYTTHVLILVEVLRVTFAGQTIVTSDYGQTKMS